MKAILDVKLIGPLKDGDILVVKDGVLTQESKISFLNDTNAQFLQLLEEFKKIEEKVYNCEDKIVSYENRIKAMEEEIKYLKGE